MRKLALFLGILIVAFLMAACTIPEMENGEGSSEEASQKNVGFYGIGNYRELVKFVYKEGRFVLDNHAEVSDFYPDYISTDGENVVAWDEYGDNKLAIANMTGWFISPTTEELDEDVEWAAINGDYVYVLYKNGGVGVYKKGFVSFNKVGEVIYYGTDKLNMKWIVFVKPHYIVGAQYETIYVIDVSTPENPKVVSKVDAGIWVSGILKTDSLDRVYLKGAGNVIELDLSDPSSPTVTSTETSSEISFVYKNIGITGPYTTKLIDINTGDVLATIEAGGLPVAYDDKLFLITRNKITVFDISNPSSPSFIEQYDVPEDERDYYNLKDITSLVNF